VRASGASISGEERRCTMANRFYIPRRSNALDFGQMAIRLAAMKQQGAQFEKGHALAERRQKLSEGEHQLQKERFKKEYGYDQPQSGEFDEWHGMGHVQGLKERGVSVAERQVGATEQQIPITEKDFSPSSVLRFEKLQLANVGLDKAWKPVTDIIKGWANDPQITNRAALHLGIANWPQLQSLALEGLEKEYQKSSPGPRQKMLEQMIDQISKDTKGDMIKQIMPATAKAIENEQTLIESKAGESRAMKSWVTPDGKVVNLPNNVTPPEGSVPYQSGMDIEVTDEGTRIRTGVSGIAGGMQRKTAGTLEDKVLNTVEGIQRLDQIAQSYRPEYQELGTRWKTFASKWKEKLRGTPVEKWVDLGLEPDDKVLLQNYTAFRRDAIDNINRHIKEITGAQMSEKEAGRIRKGMPDPGEGLLDGDSPTEFEAKWKSSATSLRMAQARYVYLLKTGMNEGAIKGLAKQDMLPSLSNMKAIINDKAEEIKAANPGIPKDQLTLEVSKYFGLAK